MRNSLFEVQQEYSTISHRLDSDCIDTTLFNMVFPRVNCIGPAPVHAFDGHGWITESSSGEKFIYKARASRLEITYRQR
jgi:hypothetical protein